MIGRRTFLKAMGATTLGPGLLRAAPPKSRKRLAVVTTERRYESHAWHLAERHEITEVAMKALQILLLVVGSSAIVASSGAQAEEIGPVPVARLERGNIVAHFRDNSQSPRQLSGIDSLFNMTQAPGFDAFDPDAPGASAGLNFEHIISGHESPNNAFAPRHGQYTLHMLPDGRTVQLVRRADDCPWKIASTLEYVVTAPYYIDFSFRCTPHDASLFGNRRFAVFFFANLGT